MDTQLILISGLPQVGKTTLAQAIGQHWGYPVFSPEALRTYAAPLCEEGRPPSWDDLYALTLELTRQQLMLGISVIVESMFPNHVSRQRASDLAVSLGAVFCPIYLYCGDEMEWKRRVLQRIEGRDIQDTFTGWSEVKRAEQSFRPWEPDVTLTLDTSFPVEELLTQVRPYLAHENHPPYQTPA